MTQHPIPLGRQLLAEGLGTGFLLATVVGSGIMAERLAGGNDAIALLGNTIATGAILFVLIVLFARYSGAHFNPAVTLSMLVMKRIALGVALAFVGVQIIGGILGVWAAHMMFDVEVIHLGVKARTGAGQWFSEAVATFGLLLVVILAGRRSLETVAAGVGLYITAAYWFTASTSFANPAVTIARSLSDSFAGIYPGHAVPFIIAQLVGAGVAVAVVRVLDGGKD